MSEKSYLSEEKKEELAKRAQLFAKLAMEKRMHDPQTWEGGGLPLPYFSQEYASEMLAEFARGEVQAAIPSLIEENTELKAHAPSSATRLRIENQRKELANLNALKRETQLRLTAFLSKNPEQIALALKDTGINEVVFVEALTAAEAERDKLQDKWSELEERFCLNTTPKGGFICTLEPDHAGEHKQTDSTGYSIGWINEPAETVRPEGLSIPKCICSRNASGHGFGCPYYLAEAALKNGEGEI